MRILDLTQDQLLAFVQRLRGERKESFTKKQKSRKINLFKEVMKKITKDQAAKILEVLDNEQSNKRNSAESNRGDSTPSLF